VDAFDANRHGSTRLVLNKDGYKDIVSGWYYYRNPGGNMSGDWERFELAPKADGFMFTDVDGDDIADFIAVAGPDVYWFEVLNQYGKMFEVYKIGQIMETDHMNGQGYLVADVIKGGKQEVLIKGGDGLYMAEIPAHPDSVLWDFILIAETKSSEGFDAVDIDADGDLDIVSGKATDDPDLAVDLFCYENPGKRAAAWPEWKIGTTKHPIDRIAAADLNADGTPEIVVTEERWNVIKPVANLWVFSMSTLGNPKGEWTRKSLASHYSLNSLDTGDIDGDGDIDIVTNEHKGPDLNTFAYLNDGNGDFSEKLIYSGVEMHLGTQLVDLDSDGDLDIIGPAWDNEKIFTVLRNDAKQREGTGKPWFVVFDDTCTVTEEDHGFYYFHPSMVAGNDWQNPFDYYNGTLHARYEVLEYPSDEPFKLSYCIWSEVEKGAWRNWKEMCCPQSSLGGVDVATSAFVPAKDWWVKDVPCDFSNINNFRFLGLVVWCNDSRNCSDWVDPPDNCWAQRKDIMPFRVRFTLIAVSADAEFKGWDHYLGAD
jgi:hypothetical protein